MKTKISTFLLLIFFFSASSACSATFTGRVIDADTKESIEGAVVVAYWIEERGDIAGSSTRYKDVKEILTDKNGEWMINGPEGSRAVNSKLLFTFITRTYYTRQPLFIVFKPGYCSWPEGFSIETCKGKIKPIGNSKIRDGETVELPKLTKREDRKRSLPGTVGFSREFDKKQLKFLKLINEERKNIFGEGDFEDYIEELENEK